MYSRPIDEERYCTIDDYLSFLADYHITPDFLTKDYAVSLFMAITSRRDDGNHLSVANYLTWCARNCSES